jgi:hypothetical protein
MRSLLLIASLLLGACTFDGAGVEAPIGDDDVLEVDAGPADPDPTVTEPDAGTVEVPADAATPVPDPDDPDNGPGGHHGHG